MSERYEEALRHRGDRDHARDHSGIGTIADPSYAQLQLIRGARPISSLHEVGCTTGFRSEKMRVEFGNAPRDLSHWVRHHSMSSHSGTSCNYYRERSSLLSEPQSIDSFSPKVTYPLTPTLSSVHESRSGG